MEKNKDFKHLLRPLNDRSIKPWTAPILGFSTKKRGKKQWTGPQTRINYFPCIHLPCCTSQQFLPPFIWKFPWNPPSNMWLIWEVDTDTFLPPPISAVNCSQEKWPKMSLTLVYMDKCTLRSICKDKNLECWAAWGTGQEDRRTQN